MSSVHLYAQRGEVVELSVNQPSSLTHIRMVYDKFNLISGQEFTIIVQNLSNKNIHIKGQLAAELICGNEVKTKFDVVIKPGETKGGSAFLSDATGMTGIVFTDDCENFETVYDKDGKPERNRIRRLSVKSYETVVEKTDEEKQEEEKQKKLAEEKKVEDKRKQDEEKQKQQDEKRKQEEREEYAKKQEQEREQALKEKVQQKKELQKQSDDAHRELTNYTMSTMTGVFESGMHAQGYLRNSWAFNFSFGLGGANVPLISNTTSSTNSFSPFSSTSSALGEGGYLGAEVWPFRGPHFGFGFTGSYFYGSSLFGGGSISGNVALMNGGGSLLVGFQKLKAIGEFSYGTRFGMMTTDFDVLSASYGIAGNGGEEIGYCTYSYLRTGFGLQYDFSNKSNIDNPKDDEEFTLSLMLLWDRPDFLPENFSASKAARLNVRCMIDLFVEYGVNYSIAGNKEYFWQNGKPENRSLFCFGIGKTFTIVGGRYKHKL